MEFCSTSLVGEIRKWLYGTYREFVVTPPSYYFLSKPLVLWKLLKRKQFEKYVFFSFFFFFWQKNVFLELNMGGAIWIFINIILHYINANAVSFSLKHIRVWWSFSSSKRKIISKAYIALIFNKCPKMHENECNLAGNTITLNFLGVIHCIRFIL